MYGIGPAFILLLHSDAFERSKHADLQRWVGYPVICHFSYHVVHSVYVTKFILLLVIVASYISGSLYWFGATSATRGLHIIIFIIIIAIYISSYTVIIMFLSPSFSVRYLRESTKSFGVPQVWFISMVCNRLPTELRCIGANLLSLREPREIIRTMRKSQSQALTLCENHSAR